MSLTKEALEQRLSLIEQNVKQVETQYTMLLGHRAEIMHQIKEIVDAEIKKEAEDAIS